MGRPSGKAEQNFVPGYGIYIYALTKNNRMPMYLPYSQSCRNGDELFLKGIPHAVKGNHMIPASMSQRLADEAGRNKLPPSRLA